MFIFYSVWDVYPLIKLSFSFFFFLSTVSYVLLQNSENYVKLWLNKNLHVYFSLHYCNSNWTTTISFYFILTKKILAYVSRLFIFATVFWVFYFSFAIVFLFCSPKIPVWFKVMNLIYLQIVNNKVIMRKKKQKLMYFYKICICISNNRVIHWE